MIPHTFLARATLRGWTVSLDGQERRRSWSRILAEEAAMEAALDVSRSGASVEVVIRDLLGGFETLARSDDVPSRIATLAFEALGVRTIELVGGNAAEPVGARPGADDLGEFHVREVGSDSEQGSLALHHLHLDLPWLGSDLLRRSSSSVWPSQVPSVQINFLSQPGPNRASQVTA
jgi:hypothetical protein